jgi:hypothetical protein
MERAASRRVQFISLDFEGKVSFFLFSFSPQDIHNHLPGNYEFSDSGKEMSKAYQSCFYVLNFLCFYLKLISTLFFESALKCDVS